MAYTPKRLFEGALSTTLTATLFTATVKTLVTSMSAVNTNVNTARAVTVKLGASGATPYLNAAVLGPCAPPLPARPHHVLEAGETIKGGQDVGTDVYLIISGVEIT